MIMLRTRKDKLPNDDNPMTAKTLGYFRNRGKSQSKTELESCRLLDILHFSLFVCDKIRSELREAV